MIYPAGGDFCTFLGAVSPAINPFRNSPVLLLNVGEFANVFEQGKRETNA
jgi:hypothetical protein